MFDTYVYDGITFNPVTITIAVIGIVVPAIFTVFVYLLLRRTRQADAASRKEMREFIFRMQLRHAAESIDKRQRTQPHI